GEILHILTAFYSGLNRVC
ncbi:hypothetical protein pipiens_019798, partial [Culex pipiens pipiens]